MRTSIKRAVGAGYFGLLAVRNWLGVYYCRLQKWVLVVYVFATLSRFLVNVLYDGLPWSQTFPRLMAALGYWIAFIVLTTIAWVVVRGTTHLDLWVYYRVWLRLVVPRFRERELWTELINESYSEQRRKPCLIRREHLMKKGYWPSWVYAIVTILQERRVVQKVRCIEASKHWFLDVDLRDESLGIYNRQGKDFLRKRFQQERTSEEVARKSREFFELSLPSSLAGTTSAWDPGVVLPLR